MNSYFGTFNAKFDTFSYFCYLCVTHVVLSDILNCEKHEGGQVCAVKQGSYRAQRADEAASVALVCVERAQHNN